MSQPSLDSHPTPIYEYYVIVPHFNKPQVLMLSRDNRWYLPNWEDTKRYYW